MSLSGLSDRVVLVRVVRKGLLYVGDVVTDVICPVNSSIFSPILKAKLASNAVRNSAVKLVFSFLS